MSENENASEDSHEAAVELPEPSRAAHVTGKPNPVRRLLANEDIVVWVVGVVLFGAVVVWIVR